jgi:hypothetical protein
MCIFALNQKQQQVMAGNVFEKYVWLTSIIYEAGDEGISLEMINEKWKKCYLSDNEELARKSFNNWKTKIEEMFNILIECDRKNGYRYYIDMREEIEKHGIRSWLLDTISVSNLLNESKNLSPRILTEKIPSSQKYLQTLIGAMRDSEVLEMTYRCFNNDKSATFSIEPYCLKVFKQRWYLLAYAPDLDSLRIYALDRIQKLHPTGESFVYPQEYDPAKTFDRFFGIIVNRDKPETIRIKASYEQSNYLKTLPLHATQEVEEENEDFTIFRYFLVPTFDFMQEILSLGSAVTVLEPKHFAQEIKEELKAALKNYS